MKKNPWLVFLIAVLVLGSVGAYFIGTKFTSTFMGSGPKRISSSNSILHVKLDGVIMDGKKLLNPLIEYRENPKVKAIVIEVNSPGGVVGPSQEIYTEIKRTREKFKKPVVVVSSVVMASGAYYAAVAADKILVAPGTMVGSIGVIMEFTNLEKLYEWAKISRFSLNTGKYKDSGAEYRQMRDDEKEVFQSLLGDVWSQFKSAVSEGRNLSLAQVEEFADGRVVTGRQAKDLKMVDDFGTLDEAFDVAAEMAGLGSEYEIFEPKKERPTFFDLMFGEDEEEGFTQFKQINRLAEQYLRTELANKPLLLMPGVF